MKSLKHTAFILAFSSIILWGCEKPYDYDKDTQPKYSPEKLASAINGTWTLDRGLQTDELSLTKESIDITDFFTEDGAKAPNITFDNNNKTFTVDTVGLMVNYFGAVGGSWTFDDDRFPTAIDLKDANGAVIGRVPVTSNLLGLAPRISYQGNAFCGTDKVMSVNLIMKKN
ncbi:MAG: DUF5004 domain-containing protein [Bacteroidia bacterium]|jgi:hypothetical protein|nr:DUF5004 domain-containing protein [Bacteroidia bacterium]